MAIEQYSELLLFGVRLFPGTQFFEVYTARSTQSRFLWAP